jgi:hypothetical protein
MANLLTHGLTRKQVWLCKPKDSRMNALVVMRAVPIRLENLGKQSSVLVLLETGLNTLRRV